MRARRTAGLEHVRERVAVGRFTLLVERPSRPDELLDEEAFAQDEYLPYWAELWPSAVALAREVAARELRGARVLELGCGLGLPSLAAARAGARAIASDWSEDALAATRRNARLNGLHLRTLRCSWADPEPLLRPAPFDLVLASDVLYERRNVEPLLELLPQLGGEALLADPGRPALAEFLSRAADAFALEGRGTVYRLRRRTG